MTISREKKERERCCNAWRDWVSVKSPWCYPWITRVIVAWFVCLNSLQFSEKNIYTYWLFLLHSSYHIVFFALFYFLTSRSGIYPTCSWQRSWSLCWRSSRAESQRSPGTRNISEPKPRELLNSVVQVTSHKARLSWAGYTNASCNSIFKLVWSPK